MPPTTLKKRGDFLRVAATRHKWVTPGMLVQEAPLPQSQPPESLRYGITASRKVGNAVIRNRAKRRLRVLAAAYLPQFAAPGHDFVLIARQDTASRPFPALILDLKTAISRLKVARPENRAATGISDDGNGLD